MDNTKNPLIFVIEDSTIYKDLIVGHLQSNKFNNVKVFKTGEEGLSSLHLNPDIVILDYSYEGISGLEFMKKVKAIRPVTDFIFLSAQNDVEVAVTIMKLGAADYIVKNDKAPTKLIRSIEHVILHAKKEKINKGFTIGVFGFFLLLLLIIAGIISIALFFNF